MKIPSKITKRQYTALNKKNSRWLREEIAAANHDYIIEAETLELNMKCYPSLDKVPTYKSTTLYYKGELNKAFKFFVTTRNKIYVAYLKGIK